MLASRRREIMSAARDTAVGAAGRGAPGGTAARPSPAASLSAVPVTVVGVYAPVPAGASEPEPGAAATASTICCSSESPSKRLDVLRNNAAVSALGKTRPVFVAGGRTIPPDNLER